MRLCARVSSLRISFKFDRTPTGWPLVTRSLYCRGLALCTVCDVSLYHPMYSNMAAHDRSLRKVVLWSFSADQSLFALRVSTGWFLCVNCCLLSSQQLYEGLFWCTQTCECDCLCVCVCVNGLSPPALAMRVSTRWHPLTYCSICAHPGDTLSSLPPCVYRADTQYPRPPVCTICRGEPCFCLSPWRPGVSSFLLHLL